MPQDKYSVNKVFEVKPIRNGVVVKINNEETFYHELEDFIATLSNDIESKLVKDFRFKRDKYEFKLVLSRIEEEK